MDSSSRLIGCCASPNSRNKFTTELRAAVMEAFVKLGGSSCLVRVANENPAAFCTLLGKLLPHELATSGGPLKHEVLPLDDAGNGEGPRAG